MLCDIWFCACPVGTAPKNYAQITDSLRASSSGHRRSSSSEGLGPNGAATGLPEPSSSADGYFGPGGSSIPDSPGARRRAAPASSRPQSGEELDRGSPLGTVRKIYVIITLKNTLKPSFIPQLHC